MSEAFRRGFLYCLAERGMTPEDFGALVLEKKANTVVSNGEIPPVYEQLRSRLSLALGQQPQVNVYDSSLPGLLSTSRPATDYAAPENIAASPTEAGTAMLQAALAHPAQPTYAGAEYRPSRLLGIPIPLTKKVRIASTAEKYGPGFLGQTTVDSAAKGTEQLLAMAMSKHKDPRLFVESMPMKETGKGLRSLDGKDFYPAEGQEEDLKKKMQKRTEKDPTEKKAFELSPLLGVVKSADAWGPIGRAFDLGLAASVGVPIAVGGLGGYLTAKATQPDYDVSIKDYKNRELLRQLRQQTRAITRRTNSRYPELSNESEPAQPAPLAR